MSRPSVATPSRWLRIVRILVLIWVIYTIVFTVISLPSRYQSLRNLETSNITGTAFEGWSTEQVQLVVNELGIRPEVVAATRLAATLICLLSFWGIGGLLLWSRSETWIGLLAGFVLFTTGPGFSGLQLNPSEVAPWASSLYALRAVLIFPTFFVTLYLFPSGSFVPRFTRYLAVLPYLLTLVAVSFPDNQQLNSISPLIIVGYVFGGLVSQVYRYRKVSAPDERQQTKWVVSALGIFLGSLILTPVMLLLFPALAVGTPGRFWFDFLGNGVVGILIPALIPLSIGISILRYRLWDIDVIIRKTLVYTVLTVLLALVYSGIVVLLQGLFGRLAGVEQSTLAVVISTLVIAALFTPLRRRIQDTIDRRFFRKKYNAQQVLAKFAITARDETDLDALLAELARVVDETLQPEHVSIWLRKQ